MNPPKRQIRADYDDDSITVYQAFSPSIALPAAVNGRFVSGFKRDRMTWIKPSFRWMMYRCGWATKPGQERVLAIRISRSGFEWALEYSAFAHYDAAVHIDHDAWRATLAQPVRIQWDPERDLHFRPLDHRSIQIGLGGVAVSRYCDEWVQDIRDITDLARECHSVLTDQGVDAATTLLPVERPYPVPDALARHIGMASAG